jgi:hypothetical protein
MEIHSPTFIELDGESILIYKDGQKTIYINTTNGKTFTYTPPTTQHNCPYQSQANKTGVNEFAKIVVPGFFNHVGRSHGSGCFNKYMIIKSENTGCTCIMDKDFNVIFNLCNKWIYEGMYDECIAITDWKNIDQPITTFYDKNFKVHTEISGTLIARYGKILFVGDRFFNLETKSDHNAITIKKFHKNELRAVMRPYTGDDKIARLRIAYELNPIIFNAMECVVCMSEIEERWCSVPCGHVNTCKKCLDKMAAANKPCCVCRSVITGSLKIYM